MSPDFMIEAAPSGRSRSEHSWVITMPAGGPLAGRIMEVFPGTMEGRAALVTVSLGMGPKGMERARALLARAEKLESDRRRK
jgi:hypothetical protein